MHFNSCAADILSQCGGKPLEWPHPTGCGNVRIFVGVFRNCLNIPVRFHSLICCVRLLHFLRTACVPSGQSDPPYHVHPAEKAMEWAKVSLHEFEKLTSVPEAHVHIIPVRVCLFLVVRPLEYYNSVVYKLVRLSIVGLLTNRIAEFTGKIVTIAPR